MKIGISGASGQLGQKVIAELIERAGGHSLVGISRSPQAVPTSVEARFGDFDQPDSLLKAYEGLDRLLVIPSSDLAPGMRGRQLKLAIDRANQAGVDQVFLMSAVGTREAASPSLAEAYWVGEQHLIKTAPCWTLLRMSYFAEAMADEIKMTLGSGVLTGLGQERVAFVSRDDVAAAAAGALLGEGHVGAIYNLTGPAVVSGIERTAIASDVVGKPLSYATITEEQLRGGLGQAGLPEQIIEAMVEIKTDFTRGKFDIVTGDAERLSGRAIQSLRDVLAAKLP